ncbi:MAG TPA: hypothetical protein VEK12_04155 [Alphaproteobacteria bacterium]|nr:hypothetical protein [Alphaproteobacteria bacterium]
MKPMRTALLALVLLLALWSAAASAQDLTGVWSANDGATYFIRQIGPEIWWFGDGGAGFSNVAHGRFEGDHIRLTWVDVPKGATRSQGKLVLVMENPGRMVARRATGGFAARVWTRQ